MDVGGSPLCRHSGGAEVPLAHPRARPEGSGHDFFFLAANKGNWVPPGAGCVCKQTVCKQDANCPPPLLRPRLNTPAGE